MGTTYKASFSFSCVKQHECVSCGSFYSYVLSRQVAGEGATQEAASAAAENMAVKAVSNDVDYHPCPNCGTVQPDMIADKRNPRYWFALILGLIGTFVPMFLALGHAISISSAAWLAFAIVAVACLLNGSAAFLNPNKNSESNRQASQQDIEAGTLSLDQQSDVSVMAPESVGHPGLGQLLGVGMSLVAVILTFLPIILVPVCGWTVNQNCYPAVVGPGEKTTVYFNQKIESIKGMWRGNGSAEIINAAELGLEPGASCSVLTKKDSWGMTIEGESVSEKTKTMYGEVRINNSPELIGKMVDLDINLKVNYPYAIGTTEFGVREGKIFSHQTTIRISALGAGARYKKSSTFGLLGAAGLLVVAFFIFILGNKMLRCSANPTRVAMGDEEEEDEVSPDSTAYQGGSY